MTVVKSTKRPGNEEQQRSSHPGEMPSSPENLSWMNEMRASVKSARLDVVVGAWKHQQAREENTFNRTKKRFGARLSTRNEEAPRNEVLTACNILNKMTELGMPNSVALRG